jgi:hypothetical protein
MEETTQLIEELSDARRCLQRLQDKLKQRQDITDELNACDVKIEALEKKARTSIKTLGCVSSETKTLYRVMADMLIAWHTLKDKFTG